jgi:phosphonatase-like hydrolase
MTTRLVVFDMAGTTVADNGDVLVFFEKAFKQNGITVTPADLYPVRGLKKRSAIQFVLEKISVEPNKSSADKIYSDFIRELTCYYRTSPQTMPAPSAEEMFYWLRKEKIRVALNTGFPLEVADLLVNRFQWQQKHLIDQFISADQVEEGRPYPYMIQSLMKDAGIKDPGEVVKIGDTMADIEEGRNARCGLVIGITSGASSRSQLEKGFPDYIIDNLAELKTLIH